MYNNNQAYTKHVIWNELYLIFYDFKKELKQDTLPQYIHEKYLAKVSPQHVIS
jgi:hypothetical protein